MEQSSLNPDLEQRIISCRLCPRLVAWREEVARKKRRAYAKWEYWGKPIPGFGDPQARVLVVGLAPGAHGANRTGRIFTGDDSGDFLFRALHRAEFANQPHSTHREDGLRLSDIYISAVCRCVPPDNKPTPIELANCRPFLVEEIGYLTRLEGIVALGRIALDGVLKIYRDRGIPLPPVVFAHGAVYSLGSGLPWLITSYHPSRQNTQTGRLTEVMFDQIWSKVNELLTPR
ncbi:MAG: uracil-DNA glycosylase [Chloroflexi bacterium]|nr:uracil-DNA glycosylase [Chloroflexota bacterium]